MAERESIVRKWNYEFRVPKTRKVRMIVHTDAKNEADDQYAIAHHLMTDCFEVKGLIGGHFYHSFPRYGEGETAEASTKEINLLLDLMGLAGDYPVLTGSGYPMKDEHTPQESEASAFLVEEAMREDALPLFVACQGALTDVASAILMEPAICERMTVIWIGGGIYPEGGMEFNLRQDVAAANVLFGSKTPVWQVPMNVYKQMAVSLAELQLKVRPYGRIGKYLFDQMVEFNDMLGQRPFHWPHGEIWGLGDSPTIGLLLFESERTDVYDLVPAPQVDPETLKYIHGQGNREIRVYKDANARLTLEDFYAKLALNYPERDS